MEGKGEASTPVLTSSSNNMDLLNDDESLLIEDGYPPPTDKDINMVFMLSGEFRGIKEEVA
jgi:hypothetical protein